MKSLFRRIAWIALLVLAPGAAGPGAIGTALAGLASLEGDPAHHVSVQPDVGHDDFVVCHDARDDADPGGAAFASPACADDHRLHAANARSLISRHDAASGLHDAPIASAPLAILAAPRFAELPASAPAALVANRHQRTVVLRI